MTASYHTHVAGSGVHAMLLAAERSGLSVLGISEHVFQFRQARPLFPDATLEGPLLDLTEYVNEVRYTAAPGVQIRLGLEVDYVPQRHGEISALCAPHPWDYLIGSVHAVDGEPLQARRRADLRAAWTCWRRYCEVSEQAVRSGLFNILAHPLRLARTLPPPPYLEELLGPVLAAARQTGVAVELNGADLGADAVAQERLILWCQQAGARVTLGADAHHPGDIAQNYPLAAAVLRRRGIAGLTGFRGRLAVAEPLPPLPGRGTQAV